MFSLTGIGDLASFGYLSGLSGASYNYDLF